MINRRTFLSLTTAALTSFFALSPGVHANERLPVVTTFSILGDMVERIGGEHVSVKTLVGPNGDTHVYQPSPADARAIGSADVLVVNGLGFEGWLERLIEAAAFKGETVVATAGVEPIAFKDAHDKDESGEGDHEEEGEHGEFDPHAWQSVEAGISYVDTITAALSKEAPEKASYFYQNRADYVVELEALDTEIRAMITSLPESQRTVVTSHDAFGYFAAAYGVTFEAPFGLGTESEASAADIAALISQVRDEKITAIFVESIVDDRLIKQIARETGASIGGTLYSDALSTKDGPAGTYIDMMRHNATMISQ